MEEQLEEEHWKVFRDKRDFKHPYASVWEVSDLGRIKRDGKIIEPRIGDWGYTAISYGCVHKIVAEAFIPKTEEDICLQRNEVDHIDGDRLNNHASNLRWCTHSENVSFPLARQHQHDAAEATGFAGRPPLKPVCQYDLDGNFIAEYSGVLEAGRINHIWQGGISSVLHGKQHTAGGYIWKYKQEVSDEEDTN